MSKRIRKYELYSHTGRDISAKYNPSHKAWQLLVRAKSIKQAYYLAANGVISNEGSVGIVFVDHSDGPERLKLWPFTFDISEVRNCWGK